MCLNAPMAQMCLFAQQRLARMVQGFSHAMMESIVSMKILSVMDMHNVRMDQVCMIQVIEDIPCID